MGRPWPVQSSAPDACCLTFLSNKYRRWYDALMERARHRHLAAGYERHHVVPRSLGGGNEKSNVVHLTHREHFLAHWLLTKFTEGRDRHLMMHAIHWMTCRTGKTGWRYEVARQLKSLGSSVLWKALWADPARRQKLQETLKQVWSDPNVRQEQSQRVKQCYQDDLGYRLRVSKGVTAAHADSTVKEKHRAAVRRSHATPETKVKLSAINKGRKFSDESRAKMSASAKRRWKEGRGTPSESISSGNRKRWTKP